MVKRQREEKSTIPCYQDENTHYHLLNTLRKAEEDSSNALFEEETVLLPQTLEESGGKRRRLDKLTPRAAADTASRATTLDQAAEGNFELGAGESAENQGRKQEEKQLGPDTPVRSLLRGQFRKKGTSTRSLCFSPVPQVFEYDVASPASRRMEVRQVDPDVLDNETVFRELISRGYNIGTIKEVATNFPIYRELLMSCFMKELREELEGYDLDGSGDLKVLREKTALFNTLLRRTWVFMIYVEDEEKKLPVEMSKKELLAELRARKVVFKSKQPSGADLHCPRTKLNFSSLKQPEAEKPSGSAPKRLEDLKRSDLVEYLEAVLLKEHSGMKIPGYEFGKTLITPTELVECQYMLSYGEEAMINEDAFEADTRRVESVLQRNFRGPFIEVLENELSMRNLEYNPESSEVLAPAEVLKKAVGPLSELPVDPCEEARSEKSEFSFLDFCARLAGSTSSETEMGVDNAETETVENEQVESEQDDEDLEDIKLANVLFECLYQSQTWRDDYPEVIENTTDYNLVTDEAVDTRSTVTTTTESSVESDASSADGSASGDLLPITLGEFSCQPAFAAKKATEVARC